MVYEQLRENKSTAVKLRRSSCTRQNAANCSDICGRYYLGSNYINIFLDCWETGDFSNSKIYTNETGYRFKEFKHGRTYNHCLHSMHFSNVNDYNNNVG